LNSLRQQSDLDLLVPVPDVGAADLAAQRLNTCAPDDGRLDGELVFPDGSAVAWREWHAWSAGCTRQCLVKQHQGATLVSDVGWLTCGTA
jgi:phosphoribosyl-dephospho-CoA transferase